MGVAASIQWRIVLLWAFVGTALAVSLTLLDLSRTTDANGWLISVGPSHPSAALVAADIPDLGISEGLGHDGAQFYAIARTLPNIDSAARAVDRPRYRIQRPLFPLVGRLLYLPGEGRGLVWALFAVGVASMMVAGIATGALSSLLRGPPWIGAVVPLLPGSLISLRITVSDTMAVALALVAILCSLRGRHRWAVLAAVAAVLTKESLLMTLVGFGLWRRDRQGAEIALVPAIVGGAWGGFLLLHFREAGAGIQELTLPFVGIFDSLRLTWLPGVDTYALLAFIICAGLTAAALVKRRFRHPLSLALVLNAAFLTLMQLDVIGLDRNGPRAVLPLTVLAMVAVATPKGDLEHAR